MDISLWPSSLGSLRLSKIKSVVYTVILVVGLAVMISPLPEGTFILSLMLSYFGYKLTGSIYSAIATYVITFAITILVIKKLNLVSKFRAQLKKIWSEKNR